MQQRDRPRTASPRRSTRCPACTRSGPMRTRGCSSWRRSSPTSTAVTRCPDPARCCRASSGRCRSEVSGPRGSRSSPGPSSVPGCRSARGPPSGWSPTPSTVATGCRWSGRRWSPGGPGSGTPGGWRSRPGTSRWRPPPGWMRRWSTTWTGRCPGAGSRPGWPAGSWPPTRGWPRPARTPAVAEQFARRTRSSEQGTAGFYVRSTVGVIARLEATVVFLADALAAFGDRDPEDLRRVKAVALLANPVRAVELLAAFAALRADSVDVPLPEPGPGPDRPDPEPDHRTNRSPGQMPWTGWTPSRDGSGSPPAPRCPPG